MQKRERDAQVFVRMEEGRVEQYFAYNLRPSVDKIHTTHSLWCVRVGLPLCSV